MNKHSVSGPARQAGRGTPIYVAGKEIGHVAGDTFHKSIAGSRHMLRRPPALCFDVASLADAERAGATVCQVLDRETGRIYRASIALIRAKGFSVNRGFGAQIALVLGRWEVDGRTPDAPAAPDDKPTQLGLFGGSA